METYGLIERDGWTPGPWDGEPDLDLLTTDERGNEPPYVPKT